MRLTMEATFEGGPWHGRTVEVAAGATQFPLYAGAREGERRTTSLEPWRLCPIRLCPDGRYRIFWEEIAQ